MTHAPTLRSFSGPWSLFVSCVATLGVASAQIGTNYCTPAPNSTGAAATISGSGSASVLANNLVLRSTSLPQNAAAFFLCSRTQAFVQNPGGSAGNICLGSPTGRLVGGVITSSGTTGTVIVPVNLNVMPQPSGAVVVQPGETWNFQCWYRDTAAGGGATSNFSGGLEVLFPGGGGNPIPGMMPIPSGTFLMGSDALHGPPYFGELTPDPVRQVTISYPFWIGQYEVTQADYQALMGVNPSIFIGATRPVETVTWDHARGYCIALTAQQAGALPAGYEYRLPTDAEWEYACRAGSTAEFHYGQILLCSHAHIRASAHSGTLCGNNGTASVGSYGSNAFSLHDMHGNVAEWCLDSHAPYSSAAVTDPFVTGGGDRIVRGGSWFGLSYSCRTAVRDSHWASYFDDRVGFRVVLAPILVP